MVLTFTDPAEAEFYGGECDGLQIPMTAAFDRVRVKVTEHGVEVHPVTLPVDRNGGSYYLRISHNPPLNYFYVDILDQKGVMKNEF